MSIGTRLARLEADACTNQERICMVVGDDGDVTTEIVKFRAENNWPDDGRHPLRVIRVVFGKAAS